MKRKADLLFIEAAERFGAQAGSLLGNKVVFRKKEIFRGDSGEIAARVGIRAAVLLLNAASGSGKAGVVFRMPDAILFAATLLMMPSSQIAELIGAGEMSQDLADAFTEVANILYGALDDVTGKTSPGKGKMRNEGVRFVDPSAEGGFREVCPSGSAFAGEFMVEFPGFEAGPAFLVLEDALLSDLFGMPVQPSRAPAGGTAAPCGDRPVVFFGRDEAVRGGIERFLRSLGIETKSTTNWDQAVAWIESRPLLILADFPAGGNGEEDRLCRMAAEKGGGIPVVGISDRPTRETILRARRAGVRAFLVHPFTPESLREKIGPYLDAGGKA